MVTPVEEDDGRERYWQRRRRPRPPRDPEQRAHSDEVDRAYDLIPEIGEGVRWYDFPYRMLRWLSTGWRRRAVPARARHAVVDRMNYLRPFNEHDRAHVWSLDHPMHNVFVPVDEHVTVAGVWLVELFPPSRLPAFERALGRNGWQRPRRWDWTSDDNSTVLQQARSGRGNRWWRLVDVVRKDSTHFLPDGIRADLPAQFEWVELRAIQVGSGLTAVIAHFTLTEEAGRSVDTEWHRPHEPILLRGRRGERRRSLDRAFAAYHHTQNARRALHDAARGWMTERVPGFFAGSRAAQPLLDLLLLDQHDPTAEPYREPSREDEIRWRDALRALGIVMGAFEQIVSPAFEKLVLTRSDGRLHPDLGDGPAWTLWGSRAAITEAWSANGSLRFSDRTDTAVAHHVESMYTMLTMLAITDFLDVNEQRYAEIRDRAAARHGRFEPSALRDLRRSFLTLSLDLSTVGREAAAFWESTRRWRWEGDDDFVFRPTPGERARMVEQGRPQKEPVSFNARVRHLQEAQFQALAAADRDYRDILSTAASIGASLDSFKIGRRALWVALVSLAVAVATIVLADVGCNSVVHQALGWPSSVSCGVPEQP